MRPCRKPSRRPVGLPVAPGGVERGPGLVVEEAGPGPLQPLLRRRLVELGPGQVLGIDDVAAEHGHHVLAPDEAVGRLVPAVDPGAVGVREGHLLERGRVLVAPPVGGRLPGPALPEEGLVVEEDVHVHVGRQAVAEAGGGDLHRLPLVAHEVVHVGLAEIADVLVEVLHLPLGGELPDVRGPALEHVRPLPGDHQGEGLLVVPGPAGGVLHRDVGVLLLEGGEHRLDQLLVGRPAAGSARPAWPGQRSPARPAATYRQGRRRRPPARAPPARPRAGPGATGAWSGPGSRSSPCLLSGARNARGARSNASVPAGRRLSPTPGSPSLGHRPSPCLPVVAGSSRRGRDHRRGRVTARAR